MFLGSLEPKAAEIILGEKNVPTGATPPPPPPSLGGKKSNKNGILV